MYIVVEGLDLSGKTTLTKNLAEHFQAKLVKEPFRESQNCQLIEPLLESPQLGRLYKTQLYIASRVELFLRLKEEKHPFVISDRNFLSNMVYQGKDLESMQQILNLNHDTLNTYHIDPVPDILIYMDIPYNVAFERFRSRAKVSDYDRLIINKARYEILQKRYRTAINLMQSQFCHQTRVITIDHNTSTDNVIKQINLATKN